ncbi:AMP-dependent synthetase [Hydrocoleum sp. CS-953]|uniref:alpha/beta fold hydrolase n=1 Tax=Hydrocoleum sp. CS-953 TaxID=1671698 RepID=UPI000B9C20E5|nr:alpha/beta fold hydrolase [Hydrocoleum sp. CS-953]OZH53168.1 AMP-dependent synthetase [Hydrocoleum sp. CS-953]
MQFNTLIDLLHHRTINQPQQQTYTFLQDGETESNSLTYEILEQQAKAIAANLQSLDAKGERVLLLYPPGLEFMAGFFGCLYAGAIAIPAYPPRPNQSLSRLESIATDAQVKFALTTTPLLAYLKGRFAENSTLAKMQLLDANNIIAQNLESQWQEPNINSDTLAFLQYTSGSTGKPKGVMISHKNILHNLAMGYEQSGTTPESHTVTWLPFGHNTGLLVGVLQPLYVNFPVKIMSPLDFLQKPFRWLMAISRYKATQSLAPNFAYDLVCFQTTPEERETLDLSSWELAASGAEPVRAETIERFASTFGPYGFRREAFTVGYGMAESVVSMTLGIKAETPVILNIDKAEFTKNQIRVATYESESTQKIVSCGRAGSDEKIIIVNPETLTECSSNQVGEIWISSPSVAQGYWNKPEATAETFQGYLKDTQEGPFLRTGDLGFLLDHELFVTGRLKDLIIIRGSNHYPQDIELTVDRSHQALRPSCGAAFSVEVESEERLVIVQEVQESYLEQLDVDEVVNAIRQAVSQQHQLQVYGVSLLKTGTIPKTSSNKIQRHACKAGFLEGSLDVVGSSIFQDFDLLEKEKQAFLDRKTLLATTPEKREELLISHLQILISNILQVNPSQLDWEQPLTSMGLDSLTTVELSDILQDSLGTSFKATLIFEYPTVAALANYLATEVLSPEPATNYDIGLVADENLDSGFASPVIAIQPKGSKPPFFCIPGGVGTAFYLHSLAFHLGQDQPFYGLQARGMDDKAEPHTNVQAIAADYIDALKNIQPKGPYFLGGHSFGGQVAFEISQQLQKQGDEIGLLAVFDIPAPIFSSFIIAGWDDTKYMSQVVKLFEYFLKENLEISYDDLKVFSPDEQLNYVTERLVKKLHVRPSEAAKRQVHGFVKVLKASIYAMGNYHPEKLYPTPIALFRSSDVRVWNTPLGLTDAIRNQLQKNSYLGWEQLSQRSVEVETVPGDHITMMLEPNVQVLAQGLKIRLDMA